MGDALILFLGGTVEIIDFGTNRTCVVNFIERYHAERARAKNKNIFSIFSDDTCYLKVNYD